MAENSEYIDFADPNFKLLVIEELMYNQRVLTPQFELQEFLAANVERELDFAGGIYEPIPEVLEHFHKLPIPRELADKVEELYQDGGNEVYMAITPQWDGEDDTFVITDFSDTQHFPNLQSLTLFGVDEATLEELRSKGIEADLL